MRTAFLLAALTGLATHPQEPAGTLEQELAALVARTNALTSFRLVYDVASTSDGKTEEGTLELLYRAPDFGRAHVSMATSEMDFWLVGDDIHVYVPDVGWKTARLEDPPVCAVIAAHFPPAEGAALRGVTVFADIRRKPDGQPNLDLRLGRGLGERKYLLGWLEALRKAQGVQREDEALVWAEEGVVRRVSRRTGMLAELAFEAPDKRFQMRLREAALDVELPPAALEPPPAARQQPADPEFSRQFTPPPQALRRLAFDAADAWLTRTQRTLDERVRADWRTVLVALNDPVLGPIHARNARDLEKPLAQIAERLRAEGHQASPERRAALAQEVQENRAGLERSLAQGLEKQRSALKPLDCGRYDELHALELEVLAERWEALVAAPILARHDQELAAALGR